MDPSATVSIWYDYFCLKKNKLKWTRSLADLKAFLFTELDEETAANSSWRSPSGGTWVFESDQLKVTWHSKSENINFEGARGKDLADRITSLLTRVDDEQVKANSVEAESVKSIEINEGGDKSDLSVNICVNEAITTSAVVDSPLSNEEVNERTCINYEEDITQAENTRLKTCVQSVPQDLHTARTSLNPSGGIEQSHNCDSEMRQLRLTFEKFADNVTDKLTNLANEISKIEENKPYSIVVLESLIDEHKKEKAELSKVNEDLREQNTGMSHTITDLHNTIDALQNEKASLLTITRLLQSESTVNNNANYSHNAYQKVSYGKASSNNRKAAKNASKLPDISNSNKFSSLTVEDTIEVNDSNDSSQSSDDECSVYESKSNDDKHKSKRSLNSRAPRKLLSKSQKHHHEKSDEQEKPPENITRSKSTKRKKLHSNRPEASTCGGSSAQGLPSYKPNDCHTSSPNTSRVSEPQTKNSAKTKRNTVIVGDSIIKFVKGWELSNPSQRVTVKSFSGANLEDMDDFINPILRKKPDQLVLHIGTNDLRHAESQVVAHGVINLAHKIEQQCPGIDIIVSGILIRTDVKALADRVSETNRLIKSLCNQNNWNFLTNSNIVASHLNSRGLHLNPSGSQLLQSNFKSAIAR